MLDLADQAGLNLADLDWFTLHSADLTEGVETEKITHGDLVLLYGFGGGLTHAG